MFLFIKLCEKHSLNFLTCILSTRVSFETSFDSKQPKQVSALSETKRLFRLFRFYSETASFDVSVKPKLNETKPKQAENRG